MHKFANEQYHYYRPFWLGYEVDILNFALFVGYYAIFLQVSQVFKMITTSNAAEEQRIRKSNITIYALFLIEYYLDSKLMLRSISMLLVIAIICISLY
jgi:hypothetical protein